MSTEKWSGKTGTPWQGEGESDALTKREARISPSQQTHRWEDLGFSALSEKKRRT